ncbi:hypothetical protein LSTR_LSTR000218 [Laodelphax striatellus]|uniref:Uncharacterized protein n=1 Tax=Laodelphax striatellus TaxID=195883 RepID=A0A482X6V2_LAOST|nr:hypothetical protein LSTR_LSTR000218 [Laodelphax striatellus]
MTARNKNRWIVNLKMAARELEIATTKLSRRAAVEKGNCKENMKKGKMKEANSNAEKAVQEINLMENYKQSSRRLKSLILLLQGRSCQDLQLQVKVEGIVRLIENAMRNRHLKNIKSILDKHGKFLLDSTDEAVSTISEADLHEKKEVKSLLEEIAKQENIEFEKVFVKKVKSCLNQKVKTVKKSTEVTGVGHAAMDTIVPTGFCNKFKRTT